MKYLKEIFKEWKLFFSMVCFLILCGLLFPDVKIYKNIDAWNFIWIWILIFIITRVFNILTKNKK